MAIDEKAMAAEPNFLDWVTRLADHSGIAEFMNAAWTWPAVESLHFVGMCLMIGSVWLFDLRLLGFGRSIPIPDLGKLIPVGVVGFGLNLVTGVLFYVSAPDQYSFNPASQLKLGAMLLAFINMLFFYSYCYRRRSASADWQPGTSAKCAAFISLVAWTAVIVFGRLITYFRPPYHWCAWC